jgi:hypothetical protein
MQQQAHLRQQIEKRLSFPAKEALCLRDLAVLQGFRKSVDDQSNVVLWFR